MSSQARFDTEQKILPFTIIGKKVKFLPFEAVVMESGSLLLLLPIARWIMLKVCRGRRKNREKYITVTV